MEHDYRGFRVRRQQFRGVLYFNIYEGVRFITARYSLREAKEEINQIIRRREQADGPRRDG